MPSWFEDHLACAPLREWLPGLLATSTWIDGGVRTPAGIARVLASVPHPTPDAAVRGTLVHTGPLHAPPAAAVADAITSGDVEVVIDLAWVSARRWWTLRPWRREPVRHDVADRIAWVLGLGLVDPQQWMCVEPRALVVTMARRR